MKRALTSWVALTLALAAAASAETVKLEKPFKNGGRVEMQLGGGAYEVHIGSPDKVTVNATSNKDKGSVKVDLNVVSRIAKIKTSGPHSDFHVVIEVPPETNLYIRLAAGDLTVERIVGNKDIESHAGDLNIYVGDPDSYRDVDASIKAGDLNADAFGVQKDGLFRAFHQTRKGHYTFHAHLGAGDLNLQR